MRVLGFYAVLLLGFIVGTSAQAAEINLAAFEFCPSTSEYYAPGGCPCRTSGTAGANVTSTGADASVTVDAGGPTDNCTGTLYVCMDASGVVNRDDCIANTNIDSRKTYSTSGAETVTFTGGTTFTGLTQGTVYHTGVFFVPSGTGYDNRNSNADTAISSFQTVASGGLGLETTNARFVGTGGNDSNDGLTHATRWLTENKVGTESATLPAGTDIYFLDDGDYGDGTEVIIAHDGDGLGDNVTLDTYCLDAGTTPIVYDSTDLDCGERAIVSGFHLNGTDTFVAKVNQEDYIGGNQKKWNPGHYMLIKNPDSDNNATDWSTRQTYYTAASTEDDIVGFGLYLDWKDVEGGSEGDYGSIGSTDWGIGYLRREIDYIRGLGKQFWIRFESGVFGSGAQNNPANHYPGYLVNAGDVIQTNNAIAFRWWDAGVRVQFLNMLQAIADELNTDPHFEGISFIKEPAIGGSPQDGTYSASANANGIEALIPDVVAMFPNSNVVVNVNYVTGGSESLTQSIMDEALANDVGFGGPDVAPACVNDDCDVGGTIDVQANQGTAAWRYLAQPNHAFEGKIPIVYSMEPTQMGGTNLWTPNGTAPGVINDWIQNYLKPSHMLWVRKDFTQSNGSIQWVWTNTMSPSPAQDYNLLQDMIQTYPTLSATGRQCPTEYASRCWTDAD